jgi:hypothetical protein
MTVRASASYFPLHAVAPITFGCPGKTIDEAISILLDDIREFMRNEESNDWWDEFTITLDNDSVITHYPFSYWAKHFGWSF